MASYRAYVTPDMNNMYPWSNGAKDPTDYGTTTFYPQDVGIVNPAPPGMVYGPGGAPLIFGSTPGQWLDTVDSSSWFPWFAGGAIGFLLAKLLD